MLATTGRLLAAHWPALLAWYLAGTLGRYVGIEVAGIVGAYSDVGGVLLLPLAPLAKLVSYVAMLLVVRDGLRHLGVLAPRPDDPVERRRDFVNALLGGIVPFVAFYTAYSYLTADFRDFVNRALERRREHAFEGIDFLDPANSAAPREWDFLAGELILNPVSIGILVAAFALRWLLGREAAMRRKWLAPLTVYLESLWVVLVASVLSQLLGFLTTWVNGRVAMVWLADLRDWLAGTLFPFVWLWDGILWFVGEAGEVILLPLAWLAVAGSIFGYAVAARAPELSGARVRQVAESYKRIHSPVRRVLRDASSQVTDRFDPIWKAIVLMWRAGPLLIGSFVLLFALLTPLKAFLEWGLLRLIGPQDLAWFWQAYGDAILLIPAVFVESVRVAVIAAGYDATLTRLAPAEQVTSETAPVTR